LWSRPAELDLPVLEDNARAVGLPTDLRFYKYCAEERFKMHKDGPWKEGGLTSRLSFLVARREEGAVWYEVVLRSDVFH